MNLLKKMKDLPSKISKTLKPEKRQPMTLERASDIVKQTAKKRAFDKRMKEYEDWKAKRQMNSLQKKKKNQPEESLTVYGKMLSETPELAAGMLREISSSNSDKEKMPEMTNEAWECQLRNISVRRQKI